MRRSSARARARRDITVPTGAATIVAISLYESPSISRKTTTSRNAAGIVASASLSWTAAVRRSASVSGFSAGPEWKAGTASSSSSSAAMADVSLRRFVCSQVKQVLRTILSSHERASPPRNPSRYMKARSIVSCTTSFASSSLPVSQRAKLYAASRCGETVLSKRALLLSEADTNPHLSKTAPKPILFPKFHHGIKYRRRQSLQ